MALAPVHPGKILKQEFMVPFGLSANKLAAGLGMPPNRISSIVNGSRSVTPDTALKLARFFDTSPEFWINLQSHYDLECAKDEAKRPGSKLSKELRGILRDAAHGGSSG